MGLVLEELGELSRVELGAAVVLAAAATRSHTPIRLLPRFAPRTSADLLESYTFYFGHQLARTIKKRDITRQHIGKRAIPAGCNVLQSCHHYAYILENVRCFGQVGL